MDEGNSLDGMVEKETLVERRALMGFEMTAKQTEVGTFDLNLE